MTIQQYNFCKAFKCPPYPSLNDTPAKIVDDFLKIDQEFQKIRNNNGDQ